MNKILEILNGLLFFLILGLQILAIIPLKKLNWKIFIPFISLFLYILYESYFMRPEVSITVPIRIDLFIIHPVIIASFTVNIIRSIIIIKKKEKIGIIALLALLAGFIYWWYYILVVCMFY